MAFVLGDGEAVLRLGTGDNYSGDGVQWNLDMEDRAQGCFRNCENRRRLARRRRQRVPRAHRPRVIRHAIQPPPPPPPREFNPLTMGFLFEKQLQSSDVSRAGRIVIPKRLAEIHLPALTDKRGFWMHLDDMDYQQVWTFNYRFWPNNHGRMYIFEHSKEFTNNYSLRLGDYIMVYKDDSTGSYLIRARTRAYYGRPQTETINSSKANLRIIRSEYHHHGDNNYQQNDFGDWLTPEYAFLIRTPCCESLDDF